MRVLTENMHQVTIACYLVFFLIMTGRVCSNNAVDAAADSFTSVILQAMDLAVPQGVIRKSKFPHWFSHKLIYYIRTKNCF
jgi:hypothetical protein